MQYLDLSLPTPAENLAADEALWEAAEEGGAEVLRFWESAAPFVVVGYANRAATEVDLAACQARGVPVLRRATGGGTVVQGPGCLNYTLVLRIAGHTAAASITRTNLWILNRHAAALTTVLGLPVRRRGDTDLAVGDRKFSGNAQRRGRQAILFHGTLLLAFDLALVPALLPRPSREPDYRAGRSHAEFLMNLSAPAAVVKSALREAWSAREPAAQWPGARTAELAAGKYSRPEWNFRF
jgi:lipoate-protein ligase A